jgi:PAS domain S-box-containing protein
MLPNASRLTRHYGKARSNTANLFEYANDLIYTHDLQGNFTSLNRAGERITGYSRAEALKMNIAQVVAPAPSARGARG